MRVLLSSVAALAIAAVAFTQTASPRETATAKVGGESVSVEYGRPSLSGRSFSELTSKLPEDRMWRAGSEQVTTLTTEGDIYIGDSKILAGKYSLYVYCPAEGEYALAVNKVVGQPLSKVWDEAPDELKTKIFANMSARAAELIQEDMEYMGPVRLSDVEAAQQRIVDVVRRLEDAGELIISGRGGEKEMVV